MMLLDLPEEIHLLILGQLDATSLYSTALTCHYFHQLTSQEKVWISLAKRLFGVELNVTDSFSPKQFYKAWLHKLGPLLGLWQRTDLRYYSSLARVTFKDQAIHVDLVSGQHIDKPLKVSPLLRARAEKDRLPQLDKYGIYDYCPGSVEVSSDQGFLVIAHREEEGTTTEDFAKYVKKELDDEDLDPEQFLGMEQRLPVQRLREMWCNISLAVFRRFPWPTSTPAAPLPPGLFQASYGPHGIELIRLEVPSDNSITGTRGVKVTGDPNVPFDKTTFEIIAPGCLDMSKEDQEDSRAIQMFMEEPRYTDFQDDLIMDFAIPEGIRRRNMEFKTNTCKGRWSCKCQVAGHGFSHPSFIAGNFVKFSDDMFGVIFLEISSFSIFKRVEETHVMDSR